MRTRRFTANSARLTTVALLALLGGCDLMRMVRDTSQGIKDTNVQLREASGLIRQSGQFISQASESMSKMQPSLDNCLLYTSPSPRDRTRSRMPSSA